MNRAPGDGLSAGEVARRLGVAVTTLRSWHRRYGLGPDQHEAHHHRRYTRQDLSRLEVMCRLTGEGMPAADAARAALTVHPLESVERPRTGSALSARAGGGNTIPVGGAGPEARGLARAAMRLDVATMSSVITRMIGARGVVHTWDHLLRPVLAGVGERHAAGGGLVEVEHLLSRTISETFAAVPRPAGAPTPRTLLASADEEQHTLPVEALAAALAERGHRSLMLGARVPPGALAAVVGRVGPTVVVLWSQAPATAAAGQLNGLRGTPLVVAAGPGWPRDGLPPSAARPASLGEALDLTLRWLPTAG
ncbi:MerR family transcriptional regulator [Phytohabitans sp. ZYX-F-186]|uniref:MerR family transcriptional regulator n=1 Tax=Phytohabitans maris TaxID=3071409 RepID=A0ABU0ZGZ5_9ACTN|nr:MerR family transcriptional regulator [Phytohabitans sp. ZYX-F-186]MDQ7906333.1 MerR family transcriptional regulator [Phytohabitans sp. ZYX-F-186]